MFLINTLLKLCMDRYLRVLFQILVHIPDYLLVRLSLEVIVIDHRLSIVRVKYRYRFIIACVGPLGRRHVHFSETFLEVDVVVFKYRCILLSIVAVSYIWCQKCRQVSFLNWVGVLKARFLCNDPSVLLCWCQKLVLGVICHVLHWRRDQIFRGRFRLDLEEVMWYTLSETGVPWALSRLIAGLGNNRLLMKRLIYQAIDFWGRGKVLLVWIVDHVLVLARFLCMSRSMHRLDIGLLYVYCPTCSWIEIFGSESEIEGVLLDSVRSCGSCTRGVWERTCPRSDWASSHSIRCYRAMLPCVRIAKCVLIQSFVWFLVMLWAVFDSILARGVKVPKYSLVFCSLWHNNLLSLVRFEKVLLVVNLNQLAGPLFFDLALVQSFTLSIKLSDDALDAALCAISRVQSRVQTLRAQHVAVKHHKPLRPSAIAAYRGDTFNTCKVVVAPVSQSKLLELSHNRLLEF